MQYKEIEGKEVIGKLGRVVGKISEMNVDTNTWKVTHVFLTLDKNIVEDLGFKKPRIGSLKASIPIEAIEAISDRVILRNESLEDLRKILQTES